MAIQFVTKDAADEKWFPLEFRPYDDSAKRYLSAIWQRLSTSAEKASEMHGTPKPDWVFWKPWEWCGSTKHGYDQRQSWFAWCGNRLAGFVNLWDNYQSSHEAGVQVLYLEHLATFPGDQDTSIWRRQFRYTGKALLAFAVLKSCEIGLNGKVGLHSENDSSLAFYRNIIKPPRKSMFLPEMKGILGPTPHGNPHDKDLIYLESSSKEAIEFLEEYET